MAAAKSRAWVRPHYSGDEIAVGVGLAVALHAIPALLFFLKIVHPLTDTADNIEVARPVIAANLLKLGHPLDPKRLPDRIVPHQNEAPKKQIIASQENPLQQKPDAGEPPPNAIDSEHEHKVDKQMPFPEDGGRPEVAIGSDAGVEGGLETDPNKVHAGDMYALKLSSWFHDRWTVPTVISVADERKLCVVFQININPRMIIWHLRVEPIKSSGNPLFDDSARNMLQKLLDGGTTLPEPPPEVADQWKGHTVNLTLGDGTSCR
ncbi:MAG TPA: hypothetical protein VGH28_09055 [Polyangiaceae bacterium]|jgi:hypothetical protein